VNFEFIMTSPVTVTWLQERTALGILEAEVLNAIAQQIEEQIIPPQTNLVVEKTEPEALYILVEGQLESDSSNQANPALAIGFLPGAVIHLQELLVKPADATHHHHPYRMPCLGCACRKISRFTQ
jgi:hypothetical protein